MIARPSRRMHMLIRMGIYVALAFGCQRESPEARLERGLGDFCEAMARAVADPAVVERPPAELARMLVRELEPSRRALGRLSADYAVLAPERALRLRTKVSKAHVQALRLVLLRAGEVSKRLAQQPGRSAYRAALGPLVTSFREGGAVWAFDLFSHETTEELEELVGQKEDR